MLTVACVFTRDRTRADYQGNDLTYTREYVDKLKSMVARHLTVPHRFVCLAEKVERGYDIQLERVWPSWWSKVELFACFSGPTLYLDLDTVITGNIDWMVVPGRPFAMWWYERLKPSGKPHWCSAFMAWDGDYSRLTRRFRRHSKAFMAHHKSHANGKGDQGYIADAMTADGVEIADIAAGHEDKIGTLKLNADAPLLYFSGGKKPHLARQHPIVEEHWR